MHKENGFLFNTMGRVGLLAGVKSKQSALGMGGSLIKEDEKVGKGREGNLWEERIYVLE